MKTIKNKIEFFFILLIGFSFSACSENELIEEQELNNERKETAFTYSIAGTNQTTFYNNQTEISEPSEGQVFYGQDATYAGNEPGHRDIGDGTITDNVTGLMWSKTTDLNGDGTIDYDDKLTYDEAVSRAESFDLAGYSDWRLPNAKELQSIVDYSRVPGASNSAAKAKKQFELMPNATEKVEDTNDFLFIKSEYKMVRINLNDIRYIEGMKEYVRIHLTDQKPVMTLLSMKALEEKLPSEKFMRVHRSYIVNLDKITTVERFRIVFDDKVRIPVSENYKEKFQEFIGKNFFGLKNN